MVTVELPVPYTPARFGVDAAGVPVRQVDLPGAVDAGRDVALDALGEDHDDLSRRVPRRGSMRPSSACGSVTSLRSTDTPAGRDLVAAAHLLGRDRRDGDAAARRGGPSP